MNWSALTFDWNRVRAFVATADQGSLTGAARVLGVAQPTIGRQVEALEEALGVTLFQRVGRGVELTSDGRALLEPARAMADAAIELSLTAAGKSETLAGSVCISVSEVYAVHLLPPILKRLRAEAPEIEIEIFASHTTSNLRKREADIAIRNFRPTENDFYARKIRDVPARFYATPDYLARLGNPDQVTGFRHADFINLMAGTVLMDRLNEFGMGLIPSNFPILTEDYNAMWEYTCQGLGIGVIDGRIGDAEPRVTRVLPNLEAISFPIWLVAHKELKTSSRVRFVYDILAEML